MKDSGQIPKSVDSINKAIQSEPRSQESGTAKDTAPISKGWDNHIDALAYLWDKEDITCPPHADQVKDIMKEPTVHVTQRTGLLSRLRPVPRARVGFESQKPHKMDANQGQDES
jgi:hypothetical protein